MGYKEYRNKLNQTKSKEKYMVKNYRPISLLLTISKVLEKIVFNLITHLPPTPLNYKKENMLNLEELILLENTKLSFKLQHHLLPVMLHSMLNSNSRMKSLEKKHRYETRNKNIPKLPYAKTKHYQTSFLFQSLKDYEMVPLEIRNSKTLSTFIIKMKRKLLKP